MAQLVKTVGTAILASLAVPIAGISALLTLFSLFALAIAPENRNWFVFLFLVFTCTIFYLMMRFLTKLGKRAQILVEQINKDNSLNFNANNLLGYPSPTFLVFDQQNQKLAMCNSIGGSYAIHELSYLLEWRYEWRNVERQQVSGGGDHIPGTVMRAPSFETVTRREGFTLVLEVADENNRILKFPMSEQSAKTWCAKLNAIVNG
jgi:hypothetical protein